MAVWVVRILDGQDPPPGSSRFPDVNIQFPAFWAALIERMAELRVTRGCEDGNFCPLDSVARAQMAVFLTRAFNLPGGPGPGFSDVGRSQWASAAADDASVPRTQSVGTSLTDISATGPVRSMTWSAK